MRKASLRIVAALTLFGACHLSLHAAPHRDDADRSVDLPRPATRVITLAPSLTELLFAAGGGDKLVGTVSYSDYPAAANKIPRIGDFQRLDLERIAALKPDLILIWRSGNSHRELERLRALGIPLFYLEPRRLEDIPRAIERIGALVDRSEAAHQAAQRLRERHALLLRQYANRPKLKVFFQVASQPLLTINDDHLIADVITLCGGENVFAAAAMLVPQPTKESVVAANPQVILSARALSSDAVRAKREQDSPTALFWRGFHSMDAVRKGQIWSIPADFISRNGPRIFDGAQAVCEALEAARTVK